MAAVMGVAFLLFISNHRSVLSGLEATWNNRHISYVTISVIAAASNLALVLLAMVNRLIGTRPGHGRTWAAAAVAYGMLLFLFFIGTDSNFQYREDVTASHMRTINTAAATYVSTYNVGYPPSLSALGPPPQGEPPSCNHAGLIDEAMTRGRIEHYVVWMAPPTERKMTLYPSDVLLPTKNAYLLQYKLGPQVTNLTAPPGCALGSQSYTLIARPATFGKIRPSFFTDQTGVIRETDEDREPSQTDSPIVG